MGDAIPVEAGEETRTFDLERVVRFIVEEIGDDPSVLGAPNAVQHLIDSLKADPRWRGHRNGPEERDENELPVRASGLRYIQLAQAYIDAHLHEPITMVDVARAACVSLRTLQAAFREHRGDSPRVLLRQRRLERARALLASAAAGATVAKIAFDCGYSHLGRFSVEYRRRFGEHPSKTLRRAPGALRDGRALAARGGQPSCANWIDASMQSLDGAVAHP